MAGGGTDLSHELICTWLGLEPGEWPPDHYRLLGLKPGETNTRLIEQHVHQRLDALRRYQMRHPEQATEALNRLAQAFVCLTEPATKERYDASLLGDAAPPTSRANTPESLPSVSTVLMEAPTEHESGTPTVNGRLANGSPVLPPPLPELPPPLPELPPPADAITVSDPTPIPDEVVLPRSLPPPAPPAEKVDPILEAARSPRARCGLGTRRHVLRRIRRTRELYEAWIQAGKYLGSVKRRTTLKGPDLEELAGLFARIVRLRRRLPHILGEAGQPGCLVFCLARRDPVPTFVALELSQRDALRRDWQAGRNLLRAHCEFLREQAVELRLMTRGQRFGRALGAFLTDQPGAWFLLILLTAANLLLWWSWFHRTRS